MNRFLFPRCCPLAGPVLVGLILLLGVLAAVFPRWPGDVALTRTLQEQLPADRTWARHITNTARPPLSYGLLALAVAAGTWAAGWRGGTGAVVAFGVAHGMDRFLKPLIGRPRPSADLVEVAGSTAGFSCPSTFALVTIATVGWMALAVGKRCTGPCRAITWTILALWLAAGGTARVVLAGHWPSDIVFSYLLGGTVTAILWYGWAQFGSVRSREPKSGGA